MKLTIEEKCYIAGFIDGEGTITLTNNNSKSKKPNENRTLAISAPNTALNILQFLKEKCGGFICKKKKSEKFHKQCYIWKIGVKDSLLLLEQISSYLKEPEKVRRAYLILKYYRTLTPKNGKYNKSQLEKRSKFINNFFSTSNKINNIT